MAHVFLSYAHEDKPVVEALAAGLSDAGHKVWWDEQLGAGEGFRDVIEAELSAADVVVAVWSKRAKASRYVLDEAEKAIARGILLPVRLDSDIPLGYGVLNTLDFRSWEGSYESEPWRALLREIARIARAPNPPPRRVALQVVRQALVVAAFGGLVIGSAFWSLYPATQGQPVLAAVAMGLAVSTPVAAVSALEVRRSGFEKVSLIARRCLRWFLYGGCFALVMVSLTEATGMVAMDSPGQLYGMLRASVTVGVCSTAIAATGKLCWAVGRHLLRLR